MAIFTKADSKQTSASKHSDDGVTIIAPGNHISGQFTITGSLHVDGDIEGEVCSEGRVEIGCQGKVTGVISASSVHVAGQVKANIRCQQLIILQGGVVYGQLQCEELVVEAGGQFYGERCVQQEQSMELMLTEITTKPSDELVLE